MNTKFDLRSDVSNRNCVQTAIQIKSYRKITSLSFNTNANMLLNILQSLEVKKNK